MKCIYKFLILSIIFFIPLFVNAQEANISCIRARAEVHQDRILLRWIPSDAKLWELINKYGVRLERLTISRAGVILDEPEVKLLAEELKPLETPELQELVAKYPIGAIIAQAIFGEDFEVSYGESPISKAITLDELQHQRFLFSLYAADLCFPVAKEVGWGWEDTEIKTDERYLYRITPNCSDEELNIQQGAIFVVANEYTKFVKPLDFDVNFKEYGAFLSWDYNKLSYLYSAYIVERSFDGVTFNPVSDLPITNMADTDKNPNAPISYLDSIPIEKTLYYRVAGITPFGSKGEYSEIVSGMAKRTLKTTPNMLVANFDKTGGAYLSWQFDNIEQNYIKGFNILHSTDDKEYITFVKNIAPNKRNYHITNLDKHIYYKVEAEAMHGVSTQSLPVLIQPIDSIPPDIPSGLTAKIDTLGAVYLSWKANTDSDIYGYRLYRGQTKEDEMIPITDIAIRDTHYIDSVNIYNLNNKVYYALTALDERYNQSEQCDVIEVLKPNTIPPTAPMIIKAEAGIDKNSIEWVSGEDPYLSGFLIMRKSNSENEFTQIARIDNKNATTYEDNNIKGGITYLYQVIAFSTGNLYSPNSESFLIKSMQSSKLSHPAKFDLEVLPVGIAIKWKITDEQLISLSLYKKDSAGKMFLYRENLPLQGELIDEEIFQNVSNEYMLIIKVKGVKPITMKKSVQL